MKKTKPSAERARSLLDYDPETGVFRWKVDRRSGSGAGRINAHAGDVAGAPSSGGRYLAAGIDYCSCPLHQLVFLMEEGEWPTGEVDHINGITTDNRRENLRHIDRQRNSENLRAAMKSNKTTGVLGVTKRARSGRFEARVISKGVHHHLGTFDDIESASAAYLAAKRRLHEGCTL